MANPLKILSDLQISGSTGRASIIEGAISGSGTLTSAGLATLNGGLTVNGATSGSGALTSAGLATLNGGLTVAGTVTLPATSVANSALQGSGKVTIGSVEVALGQTVTTFGGLNGLSGSNLVISGSQITASTGFFGDGSGITNVAAKTLATARNISFGGDVTSVTQSFDGSQAISFDLQLGAGVVGTTELATAVAGNGLTGGGGSALAVGAGTGISVAADAVSVKTGSVALSNGDVLKWDSTGAFAKSKITEDANGITVDGNLTVSGFVTGSVVRIDTTNTVVKDQFLYLNSGSDGIQGSEGGLKIAVSSSSGQKEGQLSYVSGSGWKVFDGSITGAESPTSLTGLADFTAKTLYFSASAQSPLHIYNAGANSVQGVFDNIGNAFGSAVMASSYYGVRSTAYATKGAGSTVTFILSGTIAESANRSSERANQNTANATAPAIQGLVGQDPSALVDKLANVSLDIAVKAVDTTSWTNDLVSVYASASLGNEGSYWPLVTVECPGLAENSLVRLIAVYEDYGKV